MEARIRIVVWIRHDAETTYPLGKGRFIVSPDLPMASILQRVRKRMRLRPDQAIFMFADNTLISPQSLAREVHSKHAKEGVLHLTCAKENVFGCL